MEEVFALSLPLLPLSPAECHVASSQPAAAAARAGGQSSLTKYNVQAIVLSTFSVQAEFSMYRLSFPCTGCCQSAGGEESWVLYRLCYKFVQAAIVVAVCRSSSTIIIMKFFFVFVFFEYKKKGHLCAEAIGLPHHKKRFLWFEVIITRSDFIQGIRAPWQRQPWTVQSNK